MWRDHAGATTPGAYLPIKTAMGRRKEEVQRNATFIMAVTLHGSPFWLTTEHANTHVTSFAHSTGHTWLHEANSCPASPDIPSHPFIKPEGSLQFSQQPALRSIPRARWLQSTPSYTISLMSILILSSDLRLGVPKALFPLGFPTKILHAFLKFTMCSTHLAPPIRLDLIIFNTTWC
jgi:hypothetical protein